MSVHVTTDVKTRPECTEQAINKLRSVRRRASKAKAARPSTYAETKTTRLTSCRLPSGHDARTTRTIWPGEPKPGSGPR